MTDPVFEVEEEYFAEEARKPRVFGGAFLRERIAVLEPRRPVCVDLDASVATAVELMQRQHIGCVLVTRGEKLAGIFTERDVLLRFQGSDIDLERTRVSELMTHDPQTLPVEATVALALNRMNIGGFRHLPVMGAEGQPIGIISVKDIVDYLVDFFSAEVLTVPPEPGLDVPKSREGA